ncbi:MAG: ISNCY family transposase [Nitrospira sp.]|nr:ISNCY family transposase [Nitrospira sp.]MDF0667588.1 ISNCY family transposase [Nitrospira sp.]
MVGEDRVLMSGKELRRVHVIRQALEKQITQEKAGELLGLTERQIRRLLRRVEQEGDQGLVHRGRGQPSNRRIPEQRKAKILKLYEERYGDFGPTLATEKLAERHRLEVSAETLRGWLMAKGVTHFRRRKRPHRAWRARKAHVGELVQLDGSHHDWLEGRGPQCVLMAYIDDASSRVFARFYEYEGTIPAMDSFQRYGRRYGLPLALYADKHTTYQSPAEPTVAEQLAGEEPLSQFGRALDELGVELIAAHSPQAKGRVERLFKTFQDRLVKELRLAGIATIEDANRFVEGYLPIYNRRFAVAPAQSADLHRPTPPARELDGSVCLKTTRCVRKDFTIAHERQLYQIHGTIRARHVLVEQWLDGTMRLTHQGRALDFHAIAVRPSAPGVDVNAVRRPRRPVAPKLDHPWRKRLLPKRGEHAAVVGT